MKTIYYRIKNTIRDAWYDFRVRCQRFKRGYSYSDVWNMDSWFMRTIKPMLIHLRDYGCGTPMEFVDNNDGWTTVLTEMIERLDMMDEDNAHAHLGFVTLEDYKRMTADDYKKVNEFMEYNKNRFFELFSKYFYSLWD